MENLIKSYLPKIQSYSTLSSNDLDTKRMFLGLLLARNIKLLCKSARAILMKLHTKQAKEAMELIQPFESILKLVTIDSFFIDTDDITLPNYKQIQAFINESDFNKQLVETTYIIYHLFQTNLKNSPSIVLAIEHRDIEYFYNNFDTLLQDVPFKESFNGFKGLITMKGISKTDMDIIWSYFELFVDLAQNEQEFLEMLSTKPKSKTD